VDCRIGIGKGRADILSLLQSRNKSLRDGHKLIDHPIKMKNGDFITTKQFQSEFGRYSSSKARLTITAQELLPNSL